MRREWKKINWCQQVTTTSNIILVEVENVPQCTEINQHFFYCNFTIWSCWHDLFLQANLSNANLEGALATGNTSFKGSNITGAGM